MRYNTNPKQSIIIYTMFEFAYSKSPLVELSRVLPSSDSNTSDSSAFRVRFASMSKNTFVLS